jgi:hypothetical protein
MLSVIAYSLPELQIEETDRDNPRPIIEESKGYSQNHHHSGPTYVTLNHISDGTIHHHD